MLNGALTIKYLLNLALVFVASFTGRSHTSAFSVCNDRLFCVISWICRLDLMITHYTLFMKRVFSSLLLGFLMCPKIV
ncbi:uncharacterized protein B0P05DRAFT_537088 [Gilbertella persicaria]|uniref:uncharacterized protein n=1 Tax=Gilbertella persicaria TaxID=101096 RepID=UPI0022209893|nr:uncharacterized protein B0P05DRAFT_537088 [Gilbertella persicaria]KAI8083383.1 hypothetical protein B0P05DRAFT_537088 [Gilbertella persicaria]